MGNIDMSLHEGDEWPHNTEAEQGLLGCLLIKNDIYDDIAEIVRPEYFYTPVNGRIFEAIEKAILLGRTATPVTLADFFKADGDLAQAGGADYLRALADGVISTTSAKDYGEIIRESYMRYKLIQLSKSVRHQAKHRDQSRPALDIIQHAEDVLFSLAESGEAERGSVSLSAAMAATLEQIGAAQRGEFTGVTTGLPSLDERIGGLMPGELIVLGGRPSMGKSALAVNIGQRAAARYVETQGREGARVLVFSLEMTAAQIAQRIFASQTGVPVQPQLRKDGLSDAEFKRMVDAMGAGDIPFEIDDEANLNISQISNRARRHQRRHGLDLIIIDHLHMMGSVRHYDSGVRQIDERSKGAKRLAKSLNVPVVLLSQLNRSLEAREDKRPQLSDLREAGSIEEDADAVMFVYRDEYYLNRNEPKQRSNESADKFSERAARWQAAMDREKGKAEIIVAKLRQGLIGTVKTGFSGQKQIFYELEGGPQ